MTGHINVEVKARCDDLQRVRDVLTRRNARRVGRDRQRDTYFRTRQGRLKLREGEIENALIFYDRSDETGPKRSDVILYHPEPGSTLRTLLVHALGVDVVVEKSRDIFFVDNVKFHIDEVRGLGTFVEIEAIDVDGSIGVESLRRLCRMYLNVLGIAEDMLVAGSYSDMLRGSG